MSVKQAQQDIDSAEFSEWMVYHSIKPFTFNSVENILSILTAMLANAFSKKSARKFKPADFLPISKKTKRDSPEAMEIKLKSIFKVK